MDWKLFRERLEALYFRFNRREYVHPDPLEFLYEYSRPRDREVVGLIASSLAYGKVEQILKSVTWVLERLPSPANFLEDVSPKGVETLVDGFRHRFTTGEDLALLLKGIRGVIRKWGSLYEGFCLVMREGEANLVPALSRFVDLLAREGGGRPPFLLPDPQKGSACKRLHLYLRWMVRRDDVDPGGWEELGPHRLVVPLDTHMHSISLALGLTKRRQADLVAALEITSSFKRIAPEDPVRYDFALTRWGIREELTLGGLMKVMEDIKKG